MVKLKLKSSQPSLPMSEVSSLIESQRKYHTSKPTPENIRESVHAHKTLLDQTSTTSKTRKSEFERNHWSHIGDFHAENLFPSNSNMYGIPELLPTTFQVPDYSLPENAPTMLYLDTINLDTYPPLPSYPNPFPPNWLRFGVFPHSTSLSTLLPTHGVHFFVDDWRFEKAWNQPDYWAQTLVPSLLLTTPDFSLYYDWPHAFQIFNTYRSRWLGRLWQSLGASVIPTVAWSDPASFAYAFEGIPSPHQAPFGPRQPVAVSTLGVYFYPELQRRFDEGFNEMLDRLNPSAIFWYGPDWSTERVQAQATSRIELTPIFYHQLRSTLRWKGSRKGTAGSDPFRLENVRRGLPY